MSNITTTPVITINGADFADADAIVAHYATLDSSGKGKFRATVTATMTAALTRMTDGAPDPDIATATTLASINLSTPKASPSVDYVARVADLRATLVAAVDAIDAGDFTLPEGVSMPDAITGDFRTGGTVDASAVARMVTVTGRKSGRGNVADFVASVVTDTPRTIAELRAAWSPSADYPTSAPSAGAIGAMFDRVDGGTDDFAVVDINGVRGAVAIDA